STLAKADYDGNIFITDFLKQSYLVIMDDHLEQLLRKGENGTVHESHPDDFGSFRLRTLDLQPVLDFFAPDLFVSRESSIGVSLGGDEAVGTIASELIGIGSTFLRNLQGRFFTEGSLMRADLDLDRLQTGSLLADNLSLDAIADSTSIDLTARFRNEDEQANSAALNARVSFPGLEADDCRIRVDLQPSELALAGNAWEILPATIRYKEKNIRIDGFSLRNGEQSLLADGTIGESASDTVRIRLSDFDLGVANSFLSIPLNLQGLLTGQGEAFAALGPERGLLLNLEGRQISIDNVDLGTLRLGSVWDEQAESLRFTIDNILKGKHPLLAKASYHPADKQVDASVLVDSLQLGVLRPILSSLFSEINGTASGRIQA
ncbi:MAG: hypothetical protein IJ636_07435, partial [Bacteroidales bacterium]|nr:hypothetical protein [Bacteroidales bacterium]